jgi:hypothetical protein
MIKKQFDLRLKKELLIAQGEILRLKLGNELNNLKNRPAFFGEIALKGALGILMTLLLTKIFSNSRPNNFLKQFIKNAFRIILMWRTIRKILHRYL